MPVTSKICLCDLVLIAANSYTALFLLFYLCVLVCACVWYGVNLIVKLANLNVHVKSFDGTAYFIHLLGAIGVGWVYIHDNTRAILYSFGHVHICVQDFEWAMLFKRILLFLIVLPSMTHLRK